MFKPSFAEPSKKAEASDPLKALFKINEGLRELQKQPQLNQEAPSVAQQIQQQGLAALSKSPEAPGEAIQTVPDTPMGKVAMQANVADQIKAAEQAQLQQQLMQMASQQPQQMARGGIAALTARNMKFQRGGVVGFNGEDRSSVTEGEKKDPSFYERLSEDSLLKKAVKFLSDREKAIKEFENRGQVTGDDLTKFYAKPEQLYSIPKLPPLAVPEIAPSEPEAPVSRPPITPPMARPSQSTGGLGSLMPALGKVDLSGFEADKQAALAAVQKQEANLAKPQTPQQLRELPEAEAKALGIDLYGVESKARIAALEKEFANQSAARAEANKSRGMDNLITMLTNSGGAPTLFAGLAKGTQAYQAVEKLQKADDLIWGGKKLEFMDKINNQRELLNERNKAMMLGNVAESRKLDEERRIGQNSIYKQLAEIYSNSMAPKAQAKIHEATNAVNLSIAQMKAHADAESRKLATESRDINAIESRILENSRINATANKLLDETFRKNNELEFVKDQAGLKRPPEDQKKWDAIKSAHDAEKARQNKFFEEQNYNLQYRKWLTSDRLIGLPEPLKPNLTSEDAYIVRGPKKQ